MDSGPIIQLPNPQQAIYNSQSFQSSGPSSSSSFFNLRNIAMISLSVLVVGGIGMGVMSVRNATNNYKKQVSKRSQEITQILEEAEGEDSLSLVGQADASYDNPFDKDNSYQNPFEEEENPF